MQRLQGVTFAEGANKGIIATTSAFTDPALQALRQTPWLLEGRDFNGLLEWLDLYHTFKMAKAVHADHLIVPRQRALLVLDSSSILHESGSAFATTEEDYAAKREAYLHWERMGRPQLTKGEQDRMYFDALSRIRQRKS